MGNVCSFTKIMRAFCVAMASERQKGTRGATYVVWYMVTKILFLCRHVHAAVSLVEMVALFIHLCEPIMRF
jgi:hypothetical protein